MADTPLTNPDGVSKRVAGFGHRVARGARRRATAVAVRAQDRRFQPELRHDPDGRALVLSPHLDDAVLSCFAVLVRESHAQVANVFDGEPEPGWVGRWDRVCGATDSATRARERLAEDAEALGSLGVTPVHLGFLDIELRRFAPPPSLATLDAALVRTVGAACRVVAPAGIGGHPDHLTLRAYAQALARRGMPVSLYAELPYAVVHGWPHWVTGSARDPFLDVDPFWESYLAGVPGLGLRDGAVVARLDQQEAQRKLAALRAYRTQFTALGGGPNGILSHPGTHGFEVSWSLAPGEPG